jgi:hypothetical protein
LHTAASVSSAAVTASVSAPYDSSAIASASSSTTTVSSTAHDPAAVASAPDATASISATAGDPAAVTATTDATATVAAATATDSAAPVCGDGGCVPDEWSCYDRVLGRDARECGRALLQQRWLLWRIYLRDEQRRHAFCDWYRRL